MICRSREFLGLTVNSRNMTLSLTEGKMGKIKSVSGLIPKTVLERTRLLGRLSSTIQAVLPSQIQFRHLQYQQIIALKQSWCYLSKVVLEKDSLEEFKVVDKKCGTIKRPQSDSNLFTDPHSNRCLNGGLGSQLYGYPNGVNGQLRNENDTHHL